MVTFTGLSGMRSTNDGQLLIRHTAVLNATFGGTILYGPVNTFIYCILGSKITNLEQGLTWISQHAQVTLPTLPADILVLSNSSMNELVSPVVAAAVGSGSSGNGDSEGYVGKLIDNFESALRFERNFYAILLGVWLGFALVGLVVVLWHSGGKERFYALRKHTKRGQGDDGGEETSKTFWNWGNKEKTPIYDDYAEARFRGTSPTSIPRIVEPQHEDRRGEGPPRTSTSFFDYKHDHTLRNPSSTPTARPNPTFGSIASLAEPGLAFLRLGRKTPDVDARADASRLVEKGVSSEKYNNTAHMALSNQRGLPRASQAWAQDERVETPPPFWVNRFYGAMEGVRSLFLTRGHRHGAALGRNASVKTERSFGASQVPTAVTPREDWPPRLPSGVDDDAGRYPVLRRSPPAPALAPDQPSSSTETHIPTFVSQPVYPRPMSRAPTLREGKVIGTANPFLDVPPPLPNKHDSIDYLRDDEQENYPRGGNDDGYADQAQQGYGYQQQVENHGSYEYEYEEQDRDHHPHPRETFSPTSRASSGSYAHSEAQVESADRVQTGTAALAAILANMQERRRRRADPFSTPFDDPTDPNGPNDPHRR